MPNFRDREDEEQRLREREIEALMRGGFSQLGVTGGRVPPVVDVPAKRGPYDTTYEPGGYHYFQSNPREWDAPAVAPYGEVPPPRDAAGNPLDPDEANDQQEELDREAYYHLQEREKAEEAARDIERQKATEAELLNKPMGPPAQAPAALAAPPPSAQPQQPIDIFVDAFRKLREETDRVAPADVGIKPQPDKAFSPERQMEAAGAAYDRETERRDPRNVYDRAAADRALENDSGRGPLNKGRMSWGLAQTAKLPADEQKAARDKGLITDYQDALPDRAVRSSKSPDELPNPYGESDTRWEDEFLKTHDRMSNQEIRRRAAIMGPFASDAEVKAFTDREMKFGEDYDRGLVEARERDRGERRVSREDAMALAGSGMVTPEAAASIQNRSLPAAAYPNGGYAVGRNAQKNDQQWMNWLIAQQGLNDRKAQEINADAEKTDKNVAAGLANNQARLEEMRRRSEQSFVTHDEHQKLFVATAASDPFLKALPREVTAAAFDGDFTNVPPELMGPLEDALARIKPFRKEADLKILGPQMSALGAKIPYNAEKVKQETIERGMNDTQFRYRTQDTMLRTGMQLSQGINAWSQLSEQGKRDFASYGGKGIGAVLANGLKDPHDRALAGAVWTVLNNLIQERSGVAVTESEWGRTANEIGLAQGIWDPFNTYEGIEFYLDHAADVMQARYGEYKRQFGWQ